MKLPAKPPDMQQLYSRIDSRRFMQLLTEDTSLPSRYLHWDELRRRPAPQGLSHEEWWLKLKVSRQQARRQLPMLDTAGNPFWYSLPDSILQKLPVIDSQSGGVIGLSEQVVNSGQRDRYVISSLMEEAITSSQMEGAVTTRKDAAEMLRSGRQPLDNSEQMILNNYRAMQRIVNIKDQPLTAEMVCELQAIVTENTLDNETAAGRLQSPSDTRVQVWDDVDGQVLHEPPDAAQLPLRMKAMCDFANKGLAGQYLHPVLRAVMLHFWLAYDHPFEDGNGRTARALFYWSMLNQGYWLFEFVSISSLLKKAPVHYARSFLYTQTDDNDLTYFFEHQLDVILRAIDGLQRYIERKSSEARSVERLIRNASLLNHRQRALLANALKNPGQLYSIASHQRSHGIAYATSRADLLNLHALDLLQQFKVGKAMRFRPADNLEHRLSRLS